MEAVSRYAQFVLSLLLTIKWLQLAACFVMSLWTAHIVLIKSRMKNRKKPKCFQCMLYIEVFQLNILARDIKYFKS